MTAERVVERFGLQTMDVIDAKPDSLRTVPGISAKRVETIKAAWAEQRNLRSIMMWLQEHDVSVALAARLYEAYGDKAVDLVYEDPFRLAQDVHGVGFKTADSLARKLGMSPHSPSRYMAGLRHALSEGANDGHVFLPRPDLLERAGKLLETQSAMLEASLLEVARRDMAVLDGDHVYLSPFYRAEAGATELIERIEGTPSAITLDRRLDLGKIAVEAGRAQGLRLADKQELAVEQALRNKVSVLTGGPGTGKTSTLRTIIAALETMDATYCLCAPTGRAAKRVTETTGRAASTIHRLLEFQPSTNNFGYDTSRPLPYDFVIVDEVSMLDILLFYHLLKAVPPEAHLLLVGDADQLPSVGPGNVLRDLIASGSVATVELTELFRQARGSRIVLAAHNVNAGIVPAIPNEDNHDLFFVRAEQDEKAVEVIRSLVVNRIPVKYGFDPVDDIQVLSPMHMGPAGVAALNRELQAALNPPSAGVLELQRGERSLRLGDKVMQVRNNYDKEVFNGDVGKVMDIDPEDQMCMVEFVTAGVPQQVAYEAADIDELALAYAVSVHKAQGSEFPCVVLALLPRHYLLLQRNVLYTAITRAKHLCVLVGSPRALAMAVQSNRRQARNTDLARRLQEWRKAPIQHGML